MMRWFDHGRINLWLATVVVAAAIMLLALVLAWLI
jgi:hypothetical protein